MRRPETPPGSHEGPGGRNTSRGGTGASTYPAGREAPSRLDRRRLCTAVEELTRRDRHLAAVRERWGVPPLWLRRPGFSALVRIILEQQVSLASARAAFERLRAAVERLTPRAFLELDAATLRRVGFSRQKAGYCRSLAEEIVAGRLRLAELAQMDDDSAHERLTRLRGVGRWTADIYLLMALGRPDIWPRGDLALAKAAQRVKRLPRLPTENELGDLACRWRPWRAVAARLLWHDYLGRAARSAAARSQAPGGR
jgi:DNA-3-methyladenine glycosylase II